ncbi:TrbC/VirB2 family protein [Roseomonas chloroacetimidivorans]|uniref:TrbC/VirB2 family protein n=1 Tax=Roseomonas chloroacetimidivorans TaxID=1766656 RepID=UPI003C7180B6
MSSKKTLALAAVATLVLVSASEPAFAQIAGGGSGQLSSLIQWVITNIVRVAISAGVIGVAIALLMFRFSFATVAMVAVGGLIAANYATIAGFFGI